MSVKRYTEEFKKETIKQILEEGYQDGFMDMGSMVYYLRIITFNS